MDHNCTGQCLLIYQHTNCATIKSKGSHTFSPSLSIQKRADQGKKFNLWHSVCPLASTIKSNMVWSAEYPLLTIHRGEDVKWRCIKKEFFSMQSSLWFFTINPVEWFCDMHWLVFPYHNHLVMWKLSGWWLSSVGRQCKLYSLAPLCRSWRRKLSILLIHLVQTQHCNLEQKNLKSQEWDHSLLQEQHHCSQLGWIYFEI